MPIDAPTIPRPQLRSEIIQPEAGSVVKFPKVAFQCGREYVEVVMDRDIKWAATVAYGLAKRNGMTQLAAALKQTGELWTEEYASEPIDLLR